MPGVGVMHRKVFLGSGTAEEIESIVEICVHKWGLHWFRGDIARVQRRFDWARVVYKGRCLMSAFDAAAAALKK